MREPSFSDALQVLLLQAADEGRGDVLFGESFSRLANEVGPFLRGEEFPSVYLECPLIGDPFIDVTVRSSILPQAARKQCSIGLRGCAPITSRCAADTSLM